MILVIHWNILLDFQMKVPTSIVVIIINENLNWNEECDNDDDDSLLIISDNTFLMKLFSTKVWKTIFYCFTIWWGKLQSLKKHPL